MVIHQKQHFWALGICLNLVLSFCAPFLSLAETPSFAHDGISCRLCHGGAQPMAMAAGTSHSAKCVACHTPDGPWQVRHPRLEMRQDSACLMCHTFHTSDIKATKAVGQTSVLGVASGPDSGHCTACHNSEGKLGTLSAAHRVAGEMYHSRGQELAGLSPSQACLNCHDAGSDSPWQTSTEETLAFRHQASHQYGVAVQPGQQIHATFIRQDLDPRLPLLDGKMECVTCHSLTAGTDDLLVAFENPYDLCLGCHVMQPTQPASRMVATLVRR